MVSNEDFEMLERVFPTHEKLHAILAEHGAITAELIKDTLGADLKGMHDELARGNDRFTYLEGENTDIRIQIASYHPQIQAVDSEPPAAEPEKTPEQLEAEEVKKIEWTFTKITAMVVGIMSVATVLIAGALGILSVMGVI